jgi:DNA polymerase III sliding clamp (beta) subunit (PCNA family)
MQPTSGHFFLETGMPKTASRFSFSIERRKNPMTVHASNAALAAALKAVAGIVPGTTSTPALKAVGIQASAEARTLQLSTFGGAIAARAILPVDCDGDLSAHVDARVLTEVVSSLGKGDLSLATKDSKLIVQSGGSHSSLNLLEAELPGIPQEGLTSLFTVTGAAWRQLAQVILFASTDESKPGLQAAYCTIMENAGAFYVGAVGADGFAAASMLVPAQGPAVAGTKLSLPGTLMDVVSRNAADDDSVLVQSLGDGKHVVDITGKDSGKALTFAGAGMAVTFPAEAILQLYQGAQQNKTTWTAPKVEIARARSQVAAMGGVEIFLYANGSVRAGSAETEFGQARTELAGSQVAGEPAKKWIAAGYVKKVLDALAGEAVTVKMETSKPIVLFDDGCGFSALVAGLSRADEVKFDEADTAPATLELPHMALALEQAAA